MNRNTMTELNIIELIEKHPISKLTDTYNMKLLEKIKENFTDSEQQLFISSFYCYLNYDTKNEFVVDLDTVWKWLGFSQKYNAERIIEKYFNNNIDYTKLAPPIGGARSDDEKWGGQNIKKIMMTIRCFKSLCLKAQTKKASEIHEYYMKMEEVLHEVMEEEGIELKNKMKEQKRLLDQKSAELEKTKTILKQTPELEKHRVLLNEYGYIHGALVYIVRIKLCEDGKYIIKIGESRKGIKNRLQEFKKKYGDQVLIMECFPVHDSVGFEKYIHHHPEIHPHQVKNLKGHEMEQELFMMGGELTYQRLIHIIETSIMNYNNPVAENERLKLEIDQLRAGAPPASSDNTFLLSILEKVKNLESSNKEILARLNAMQTKTTTACEQPDPHLGPRLQKIHPETLSLVHVYETVTECMKEDHSIKRPSINKAVRENTIYHGFRWNLVGRDMDASVLMNLPPTKVTKQQKNGYIAKMNIEKTAILNVYLDRKTAARCNSYPSISSLDNAVKHQTIKDGHYYQLYEECDESLRNRFQEQHGDIVMYHDGIGKYNGQTKIAEYKSRFDCTAQAGIGQKSLAKVLDTKMLYKGFRFVSLGEKLYM
jgi:phage anti-repressor protein